MAENTYDKRFYILQHSMSHEIETRYKFNDQWKELHHRCLIRIQMWYINFFNCPNQSFQLPEYVYGTHLKTQLFVGSVVPGYGDDLMFASHIFIMNPSFIFGGWKANNDDDLSKCQQPLHIDYCSVKVDGNEHSVATNPRLVGKAKPTSIIIPLGVGDYRCINFRGVDSLENVKIDYGEVCVFHGWVPHGGETHDKDLEEEPYSGHPCIHIYVRSREHMSDLEKFEFDVPGMMIHQPSQVPYMLNAQQKLGVQQIQQQVINVHRSCKGSKSMDTERGNFIKKLKEI